MPLPPLIRRMRSGASAGSTNSPARLLEVDDQARAGVIAEPARDETVGVGGDRQLEQSADAVLGAGGRVGAGLAAAVDLDA